MLNGMKVPMTIDNLFPLPILFPEGSLLWAIFFFFSANIEWKYSCPEHSADCDEQYVGVDADTIAAVISMAGQIVEEAGIPWLQTFLTNLEKV